MPIYEYQCDDCGHRSEAIQRLADDPLTECLECGGVIRRLISAPAFQFKGSGWYVTDYGGRKGGKEEATSSTKKGDAKSEAKSDGSTAKAASGSGD